jgi:hypothetical protein
MTAGLGLSTVRTIVAKVNGGQSAIPDSLRLSV